MVGDPCRTTGSATENKMVTEPAEVTIGTRKTGRIADLTGGLGVDSWAFSEVAEEVLYNEMNPALAAAARHNFKALGVTNIFIKNSEATSSETSDRMSYSLIPREGTPPGRRCFCWKIARLMC